MHYCCDSIELVQRSNFDDGSGWCKIYLNADNNRQRLNYNMFRNLPYAKRYSWRNSIIKTDETFLEVVDFITNKELLTDELS